MQPAAKEFLQMMNKWYREKLIDPQYLSLTEDMMWGQMLDDLVGATFQAAASNCDWLNKNNKKNPDVDWLAVVPPKNVSGGEGFVLIDDRSGGKTVISASCKNPEIAVKWVDYLFSEEGTKLTSLGIEGVHCQLKDGKLVYTEDLMKDDKWYENSKKAGIDPSGVPQILRPEFYDNMLSRYSKEINDSVAPLAKYLVVPFPNYIASDEESSLLSKKLADITTYSEEIRNKFIVGTEPIGNFDKYVQKLKELGIEDIIKVKQAQYDRGAGR
jgi:putative aldouronate transport system substrate-binding protein